jgi:glycosyltransferase involved in cell wall biosynthesis
MKKVLIIVPAFNEARSIQSTLMEIQSSVKKIPNFLFQILVVDDGSSDETKTRSIEIGARVIRLPVNLGIGGAVQMGYIYARESKFDIAVQVDGDGQHHPDDIVKLLTELETKDLDLVIGSRFKGEATYQTPFARR